METDWEIPISAPAGVPLFAVPNPHIRGRDAIALPIP